jgi:hypothetical protein
MAWPCELPPEPSGVSCLLSSKLDPKGLPGGDSGKISLDIPVKIQRSLIRDRLASVMDDSSLKPWVSRAAKRVKM